MAINRSEWGVRLSDRVRAALSAGHIALARRLVAEGDGMAKNLEKEYSLMAKGLGISIRALLDLLDYDARRVADDGRQALSETLRRFCEDIEKLARCDEDPEPIDLSGWFARTRRRLAEAEAHFDREHGSLARLILEALDRSDGAAARELVDRKEFAEFVPLHDRLVRFMAEVLAWVLEHLGAEELRRFHFRAAEAQRRGFEAWERLPPEGFARATAFLIRQHMGDTTIWRTTRSSTCGVRSVVRTPAMGVPRSFAQRWIVHGEHLQAAREPSWRISSASRPPRTAVTAVGAALSGRVMGSLQEKERSHVQSRRR